MMKRIETGYLILFIFFKLINITLASEGKEVTFTLLAPKNCQTVHLAGDFNEWSTTRNPMQDSDGDGFWETNIVLPFGVHEYRFVVDGRKWLRDPLNPDFGGARSNSIIKIRNPQQPVLKDISPQTGSMLNSNRVVISARFLPGMYQVDLHPDSTFILFDGQPLPLHYDPATNRLTALVTGCKEGEHKITISTCDKKGYAAFPVSTFFVVNAHDLPPVAHAGYTQTATCGELQTLSAGLSYDPDQDRLRKYKWKMIKRPPHSKAKLKDSKTAFPKFLPDEAGEYRFSLSLEAGRKKSVPDTVNVFALKRAKYPTRFAYRALGDSSPVTSVDLAGEFNQWQLGKAELQDYNHDGIWEALVDLPLGEYEYKYVINKTNWIADPANPVQVSDGWNGINSVKTVSFSLAPVPEVRSSFMPGKIRLDASTSQIKAHDSLKYYWFQDIRNPAKLDLTTGQSQCFKIPRQNGRYIFYLVTADQFGASPTRTISFDVQQGKCQLTNYSDSPHWCRDAIIYEIYVRNFTPEQNLQGVQQKLDYIRALGINCIWLMPIFESPTEHGYGPTDFFKIAPEYGSRQDLQNLIQAAHQKGIKVVLDFIANHTSDQHNYFKSAGQNTHSIFRDWYSWSSEGLRSDGLTYEFYNDWDALPNLNYDNPQVWHFVHSIAKYWLEMDADGYRCDVAWGVPHRFWKSFRRELKNIQPECLLLNEVLPRSPKYHEDEFDMSYDTDFYGNLIDIFNHKKPVSALNFGLQKSRKNYPSTALSLRYLENHDMERFIHQFSELQTRLAAALLFTIPGTPLLYFGQEIGLTEKRGKMNWGNQAPDLLAYYKRLIKIRREHQAIRSDKLEEIPTSRKNIFAFLRQDEDEQFLIILNFSENKTPVQLKMQASQLTNSPTTEYTLFDRLNDEKKSISSQALLQLNLTLEPFQPVIYQILKQ